MAIDLDAVTPAPPVGKGGGFELTSLTRPGSPDINYFPGDFDDYDEVDSGDLA